MGAEFTPDPRLSPEDMTARYPGTNEAYWAQLRYMGTGPRFIKLSAKKVVYALSDVIEWEENRKGTRTSELVIGGA